MLYEMHKNIIKSKKIKMYINNYDPTTNFPLFQYYNLGPYLLSSFLLYFFTNYNYAYIFSYTIPIFIACLGIFFYSQQYNPKNRFVAPILFILSPYMIIDILARNAYSEVWAFSLLPLLFLMYTNLINKPSKNQYLIWLIISSFFLTTHNITTMYTLIIFIIIVIIQLVSKPKDIWKIIKRNFILVTPPIILSSFYLFPTFYYRNQLVISNSIPNPNLSSYLSSFKILLSPIPFSDDITLNKLPIQVGWPLLLTIILIIKKKKYATLISIIILFTLISFYTYP